MEALLDPDFRWDGTSSDLAQQFFRAHQRLAVAPPALPFTTEELPDAVQRRLAAADLRFEQLPTLLQRALLWDAGLVFGSGRDLLQVYTAANRSMAQLAVSLATFRRAGCAAIDCDAQFRSQFCNGTQILTVVPCVTDNRYGTATNTAMWATGSGRSTGDNSSVGEEVVPEMRLLRHQWVDGPNATSFLVYAIHTVPEQHQPAWSQCPAANRSEATGLTVPCGVYTEQQDRSQWQHPPPSAFVSKWLEIAKQELPHPLGVSTTVIVVGVCGGVIILLAIGFVVWWWRRRQRRADHQELHETAATMLASGGAHKSKAVRGSHDLDTFHSSTTPRTLQQAKRSPARFSDDATNTALRMLMEDPNLDGKRLELDEIAFQRQVSKGAFGEVWLANHRGLQVAVKRIRQDKKIKYQDLEDFTAEIQLTASLDHPNLVLFVGVAWRSLDSLCMVTEYMANGDLQAYLETHSDTLTGFWTAEKTAIALGVARALSYLHDRSPPLIHRDVKAKNVLLDEQLSPRLMDFGVSRLRELDRTMTSGIGTPFWTAPEIVEGLRYTESSDMYSFGVLLTELETCKLPYHDHQSRQHLQFDPSDSPGVTRDSSNAGATAGNSGGGTPLTQSDDAATSASTADTPVPASLRPFLILNLVMSGALRPSLSPTCPEWLRDIVAGCFRADPSSRPTARQLVEILSRQWSMLE